MTNTCHVAHHNECTKVMSNESILATLHHHGVRAYVFDGVVLCYEEATRRNPDTGIVENASAWITAPTTICDVAAWLGY